MPWAPIQSPALKLDATECHSSEFPVLPGDIWRCTLITFKGSCHQELVTWSSRRGRVWPELLGQYVHTLYRISFIETHSPSLV